MHIIKDGFILYIIGVLLIIGSFPAVASMPSDDEKDVLIISTILRFNDANKTSNYSVFRDMSSKEFRKKNSVKNISAAFKEFRNKNIDLSEVVVREIQLDEGGETFFDGVLKLSGIIELSRFSVTYLMRFVQENNEWKMHGVTFNVLP